MKRYLGPRKVLKIYIDSNEIYKNRPVWEAILILAKNKGVATVTIFKGVEKIDTLLDPSQKLSVVIEMIDKEDKIMSFLNEIDSIIKDGLITLSDTDVISYKHSKFNQE
ncbi:MAG TPA: DUF190 domain-containing protein [Campylobacterales bacterium]|nr:DUF190 domain-containing protein [Campylobacterales bacterium]